MRERERQKETKRETDRQTKRESQKGANILPRLIAVIVYRAVEGDAVMPVSRFRTLFDYDYYYDG